MSHRSATKTFCLLISVVYLFSKIECQQWVRHSVLDKHGVYHLLWNPPMENSTDITFRVEVKAKGYFGFGFSPDEGMRGSDMVTGWIKEGDVHFQDHHKKVLNAEKSSKWHLISGYENDTHTVFEFSRKLETCDPDDVKIDDSTINVIYSYSDVDPESEEIFNPIENLGLKRLFLLEKRKHKSVDKSSLSHWDVLAPNLSLPEVDTFYFCKIYKSPEVKVKTHLVLMEPFFQKGNEELIHHMILNECVGADPEEFEPYANDNGLQCHYGSKMPGLMKNCEGFFIGWEFGSTGLTFPEDVGIPLVPGAPKYYRLEIHYNNPTKKKGIVDHSGFRMYYTEELRKYDGGILMLGTIVNPRSFIPPKQEAFIVAGHTSSECLDPNLPAEGFRIFGVGPHSHNIARGFKVRHFRNSTELPPLIEDNNFYFKYQETRQLNKDVIFLPGDQITVECRYNSSERTSVTFGGESVMEEMCIAFLAYYPRINSYASLSLPQYGAINKALGKKFSNEDLISGRFKPAVNKVKWSSMDINKVQKILRYGLHDTMCFLGNGSRTTNTNPVSYPEHFRPYVKTSSCVSDGTEIVNEKEMFIM